MEGIFEKFFRLSFKLIEHFENGTINENIIEEWKNSLNNTYKKIKKEYGMYEEDEKIIENDSYEKENDKDRDLKYKNYLNFSKKIISEIYGINPLLLEKKSLETKSKTKTNFKEFLGKILCLMK